jgi:hypothetical protein
MSEVVMIPNGTAAVIAEYTPQVIPEYADNPYTEALPPIMPPQEIARRLSAYPPYNPEERKQASHYRIHFVRRLFQVFQPCHSIWTGVTDLYGHTGGLCCS